MTGAGDRVAAADRDALAAGDLGPHRDPVRVERIHRLVDVAQGRGLEVGPLYAPLVTRTEADVRYVDVHFTPELRAHYATHPGIPVDDIVDVDFALIHEGKEQSLAEAAAPGAPYDWIVASHVIEHVPDVIGWLNELAELLADGGRLVLAVPDRRFCFDVLRPPTTVGQMIQAQIAGHTRPTARAIFDHFSTAVDVTAVDLWQGRRPGLDAVIHGNAYAWDQVQAAERDRSYVDCHVWLFTPGTLATQLRTLGELGLIDFTWGEVMTTFEGELEFLVTLERVPRGLPDAERRAAVLAGYPTDAAAQALDEVEPVVAPGPEELVLSPRERRAVELKRKTVGAIRRALRL